MDDLTCSECRKKDTSECPMARAERTVTGEFSGFKTAFEGWEGCSRGEQSTTNADHIRAMSDEELAEVITCPEGAPSDRLDYRCVTGCRGEFFVENGERKDGQSEGKIFVSAHDV